jgi:hypothetical protein
VVVLQDVSASKLAARAGVESRLVGAPLLSASGVIAVAAGTGRDALVPAGAVRAFLAAVRPRRSAVVADSTPLPMWPSRPLGDAERTAVASRDVETYRAHNDGFEVLVMTPRVAAWRRAAADSAGKGGDDPFAIGSKFKTSGGIADPIQSWKEWDSYWNDRRAVVVIEVAPDKAAPPFHGSGRPVDFSKGNVGSVVLKRDGVALPAIETATFRAVPDTSGYGGRPIFRSGVIVVAPDAFATGTNFTLEVSDAARAGRVIQVKLERRTIAAIQSDLAAYLTR